MLFLNKDKNIIKIQSRGMSMLPLIRGRDTVYIEKIKQNNKFYSGDIVVFPFHGRLLCHRIILVKKRVFITKGDNSWRGEVVKPMRKVIGKVIAVTRQGKVIDFRNPWYQILNSLLFCFSFLTFLIAESAFFIKRIILSLRSFQLFVGKSD